MPEILEVVGPRSGAAPLTYTLTELGTVEVQSVFAHFDGSGAGGSFRPTLTIRSQDGTILARLFPSTSPAAGDTADVTFAPFLGAAVPSSTDAVRFNNANDSLTTRYLNAPSNTNGPTDPDTGVGWGLLLADTSSNGVKIRSKTGAGAASLTLATGQTATLSAPSSVKLLRTTGGQVSVESAGVRVGLSTGQKFTVEVPTLGSVFEVDAATGRTSISAITLDGGAP